MSVHYFGKVWQVGIFRAQCHVCERVEQFESELLRFGSRHQVPVGWRSINRHVPDGEWGWDEVYTICDNHPDWKPLEE